MKIALYSRGIQKSQTNDLQELLDALNQYNVEVIFYKPFFETIKNSIHLPNHFSTFSSAQDLDQTVDSLISLGGDGTMLDTVTLIRDSGIPVIGINFGRLGFLAAVNKSEIDEVVHALVQRKYTLERRSLVHFNSVADYFSDTPYALNEFSIHKKDTSPMIEIHTYLNTEFLSTYWADGVIVASPTGSTGYSLSCGGPIIFSDCASFVITPIAPHNLSIRPTVIPDSAQITFKITGRTDGFICALDSRRVEVPIDTDIIITKEHFGINLIRLHNHNFLQTLRNKLSWGLDKRNSYGG